jgi:hypothetical protein
MADVHDCQQGFKWQHVSRHLQLHHVDIVMLCVLTWRCTYLFLYDVMLLLALV